jgi:hypothetical protein
MSGGVSKFAAIDENGRNNMLGLKPNRFAFQPRLYDILNKTSILEQMINLQREGAG